MARPNGSVKVGIVGAVGRMGREVARSLHRAEGVEVVMAVDHNCAGESLAHATGVGAPEIIVRPHLGEALDQQEVNVIVDFTHPGCATAHALSALKRNIAPVIGTSGIGQDDLREIRQACADYDTPAMVVPNFAIGAVLMMKFAELAAKWMPDVEIIELHHDQKADAPSGTAKRTAELIAAARQHKPSKKPDALVTVEGALGATYHGVPMHSVRLKGLVAHQVVLFGGDGETLMIRHDSLDRASFARGVELCVKKVWSQSGLVVGMDRLLV